jgi:RNA polymerase sigma factor for flagellar operon FliA
MDQGLDHLPVSISEAQEIAGRAAYRVCQKIGTKGDLEELTSEALIGIIRCVDTWQPHKSAFKSYAYQRAYFHLIDWLREQSWLPRLVIQQLKRGELDFVPQVQSMHNRRPDSNQQDGSEVGDTLTARPEDDYENVDRRDTINHLLDRLGGVRREIIERYYLKEETMKEIGEAVGLSESRVSQLHSESLGRLRGGLSQRVKEVIRELGPDVNFAQVNEALAKEDKSCSQPTFYNAKREVFPAKAEPVSNGNGHHKPVNRLPAKLPRTDAHAVSLDELKRIKTFAVEVGGLQRLGSIVDFLKELAEAA